MSDGDIIRLCLALAASLLFHVLLLGMQRPAAHDRKVVPAASNSQLLNVVLAGKPGQHREDAWQKTTAKRSGNTAARKIRKQPDIKEPGITPESKVEESMPQPPGSARNSAQSVGVALQSMVTQQYMMMRLQQFFSTARRSASRIIKSRFGPDKLAQFQGERCTLHLVAPPALEQGYETTQAECDDPDLVAELEAMPWGTMMPPPSEYSLPYRGLVIHLEIGSFDVSIGLEPLVN